MSSEMHHSAEAKRGSFRKSVTIAASPVCVWAALTEPAQMREWMFSSPIEVVTDWVVGGPIAMSGDLHGVPFTNLGVVLAFEPLTVLRYSHLNSVSRLPDTPDNHALIEFALEPERDRTILTVSITQCPTDVIYKHLAFYWTMTLDVLQRWLADVNGATGSPGQGCA